VNIYKLDTPYGTRELLTEEELQRNYTQDQIKEFKQDEETIFNVTNYNMKQLNIARAIRNNEKEYNKLVDEYDCYLDIIDIIEMLFS